MKLFMEYNGLIFQPECVECVDSFRDDRYDHATGILFNSGKTNVIESTPEEHLALCKALLELDDGLDDLEA